MGSVALVVGGSRGVGAEVTKRLGNRYQVETWARTWKSPLDGVRSRPISIDATDSEQVARRFAQVSDPFSWLVYCAGTGLWGTVGTQPRSEWEEMLAVNVTGLFTVVSEFRKRWGHVPVHTVILGSEAADFPQFGRSGYHASKAALAAFSESLRLEANAEGAKVTLIVPGRIDTGFVERAETVAALSVEDIARAVQFALEQPLGCQIVRIEMSHPLGPFKTR